MTRAIYGVLFYVLSAVCAFAARIPVPDAEQGVQVSVNYLYEGSHPTFGPSWFGMDGGSADVLYPFTRHFGAVAEFSGTHTGTVPLSGDGLTLLTYTAGPRFSTNLHLGRETRKTTAFGQVLFGGAHGADGAFPEGTALSSTANSIAFSVGAGLHVGLNRRVSLRLIQAEYLYTRLPNLFDNYQNSYRIGAGVVVRLP